METEKLISKLIDLPKRLAAIQLSVLDKSQSAQKISNEIMRCETKLRVVIAGLTDDAGKKLHSNEDARRSAFAEMSEEDIELNELKKESSKIERDVQEERINFDTLISEQKNIRSILMFLSGTQQ